MPRYLRAAARVPQGSVVVEAGQWGDEVEMGMEEELLVPGVEDGCGGSS